VSRTSRSACRSARRASRWSYNASASAPRSARLSRQPQLLDQLLAGPCVDLVRESGHARCAGAAGDDLGKATNCGTGRDRSIRSRYNGNTIKTCPDVAPGGDVHLQHHGDDAGLHVGSVPLSCVSATATADCGSVDGHRSTHNVPCQSPQIDIEKVATEATVPNLGTIHYTITLRNPSSTVALEDIVVTDHLCSYARFVSASPAPFSAPAVGANGDVVWHVDDLAPGAQLVFTLEVTADVVFGGGTCPTTVQCPNVVEAIGLLPGLGWHELRA
jgi:uncharacterized repeat protein (TIGR01451 family)